MKKGRRVLVESKTKLKINHWRLSPEPPELAGFHVDSLTRATTGKVEYHSDQPESPLGPGTQWAAPRPCHWQASFSKFFLLGQKAAMLLVRPLSGSCRSSLLIGA